MVEGTHHYVAESDFCVWRLQSSLYLALDSMGCNLSSRTRCCSPGPSRHSKVRGPPPEAQAFASCRPATRCEPSRSQSAPPPHREGRPLVSTGRCPPPPCPESLRGGRGPSTWRNGAMAWDWVAGLTKTSGPCAEEWARRIRHVMGSEPGWVRVRLAGWLAGCLGQAHLFHRGVWAPWSVECFAFPGM